MKAVATLNAGAVIDRKDFAEFQRGLLARDLQMDVVARVPGYDYSKGKKVDLLIGKIAQATMQNAVSDPVPAGK